MPVQFKCDCSKKKVWQNNHCFRAQAEIQAMIDEDHGAEAVCSLAIVKYTYTEDDPSNIEDRSPWEDYKWITHGKSGNVEIPNRVVVAPNGGITNAAFRVTDQRIWCRNGRLRDDQ